MVTATKKNHRLWQPRVCGHALIIFMFYAYMASLKTLFVIPEICYRESRLLFYRRQKQTCIPVFTGMTGVGRVIRETLYNLTARQTHEIRILSYYIYKTRCAFYF